MFNREVVCTDWFTGMPLTAQALYFQICMSADDDGFVTSVKTIMFVIRASQDDLAILIAKNYVIKLENGLYLIKHWRQNNYTNRDCYTKSAYADRLESFEMKEDGSYTLKKDSPERKRRKACEAEKAACPDETRLELIPAPGVMSNELSLDNELRITTPACQLPRLEMSNELSTDNELRISEVTAKPVMSNELSTDNELRITDINNQQPKAPVGERARPCTDVKWWPIIKEFGYLKDEKEYRRKCYQELLDLLASTYGEARTKLYLKLFVSRQEGREIRDRFAFLKKCLTSDLGKEAAKDEGEGKGKGSRPQEPSKPRPKPGEIDFEADYQARNANRIEDDAPHATDEDVDNAFKELFGGDYEPKAS